MTHSVVLWSQRREESQWKAPMPYLATRGRLTPYTQKRGTWTAASAIQQLTLASSVTVKGLEWKHVVLQSLKGWYANFSSKVSKNKFRYVQACYKQWSNLIKIESLMLVFEMDWFIRLKLVIERLCFCRVIKFLILSWVRERKFLFFNISKIKLLAVNLKMAIKEKTPCRRVQNSKLTFFRIQSHTLLPDKSTRKVWVIFWYLIQVFDLILWSTTTFSSVPNTIFNLYSFTSVGQVKKKQEW